MNSRVKILLWERWQVTRWPFILLCLFPLIGRLLYLTGFNTLEQSIVGSKLTWFLGFSGLNLMLLVSHCEVHDMKLSFQERLFRYPVRTGTLIAVYMGYGIAAIAVQALLFFGFEILFFDSVNVSWSYFLTLETAFIVIQTISWLTWVPGTFFNLLLAFISSGAMYFSLYSLFSDVSNSAGMNILCMTIILFCCGISILGVSGLRHNRLNFSGKWTERFFKIFRKRQPGPFKSPLEAQTWLESRQTGYLFPFTFLCIIVPLLIIILIINIVMSARFEEYMFPPLSSIIPFLMPLSFLAAFLAGMFSLAVYNRVKNREVSSFRMKCPLSTREMASARFQSYIKGIAHVFAMVILISMVLIIFDWSTGKLDIRVLTPVKWALRYDSAIEIITMTLLGLYGYILYCWTMLFIGSEMMGFLGIAVIIIWIIKFFIGDTAAEYALNILLAAIPVLLIFLFCKARQKNLITSSTVLISIVMFPLAVLSLWAYPWYYTVAGLPKGLPDLSLNVVIYIIVGAVLPFIPLAVTPLIIDKLRHQ